MIEWPWVETPAACSFAKVSIVRRVFGFLVIWLAWSLAAGAQPTITETLRYYDVDATTLRGLEDQMAERGPNGFWGFARWQVSTERGCKVTVRIHYTLPRHTNLAALSTADRAEWERMTSVLEQHERNHGRNGKLAAQEVQSADCKGKWRIIRKWVKQDRLYDKRTNHGRLEGIILR